MITLAVVIVTFNGQHCISQCLDSILNFGGDLTTQTIVVDNLSTDGTQDIVRKYQDRMQGRLILIENSENTGFGRGNNIGIAAAFDRGAEYIFLLNQDALLEENTISLLTEFMTKHKDIEVCSPLHMSPDWGHVDSRTYEAYLRTHASAYVKDAIIRQVQEYYEIFGINAAAWFMRASALEIIGGFDPLFFMYGEDDDMLNRMKFHGIRFALLPAARILHLRQSPMAKLQSNSRDQIKRLSLRYEAQLLVLAKSPAYGQIHGISQTLVHGLLMPLCRWILDRDHKTLCAWWLATARIVPRLSLIAKARRLSRQHGRHYIAHHQATHGRSGPR